MTAKIIHLQYQDLIMKKILLFLTLICIFTFTKAQNNLKFEDNQTLTWQDCIDFYKALDARYENAKLTVAGETDAGKPLHLFIISNSDQFDPQLVKNAGKAVLLINNGIHPGEPCGVDASAKFAWEVLEDPELYSDMLDSMTICIIPMLNVGGALNRGANHRANQDGPQEHGFRANATNNDLNRDFIKLDTRNARAFVRILRAWDPDILIDTHTSNGADYQYVLTLINTQHNKMNEALGTYLHDTMLPALYDAMDQGPYEMTPYVMSYDRRDPANGIVGFMDHPRYTTGYASLFSTIGFTLEAHMFKPFKDRVLSTYYFLKAASDFLALNKSEILKIRMLSEESIRLKKEYTLHWTLDTVSYDTFLFKGFEIKYRTSNVTGQQTYYFDRKAPWEKEIRNYCYYAPQSKVLAPDFYLVPAAWREVVELLMINDIEMYPLPMDTTLEVEYYYIEDFNTSSSAYNGHYYHSGTKVRKVRGELDFLEGDLMIPMNQAANEFLVQVLEPEAVDSYFNWNFFDPILSRKEYFSPYVFDEKAEEILSEDPVLRSEFKERRAIDAELAESHYAQLRYIYERSKYSEKTLRRYPVVRYFSK